MTDLHLKPAHSERIQVLAADTVAGQAHWAGTGPEGTRCVNCAHARFSGYYAKSNNSGSLKPITCAKYKSMMGHAPKFDSSAKSCRFFEQGDGPPKKV